MFFLLPDVADLVVFARLAVAPFFLLPILRNFEEVLVVPAINVLYCSLADVFSLPKKLSVDFIVFACLNLSMSNHSRVVQIVYLNW